jgi:DNA-binding MarR family transcriptional regulator
VDGPARTAPIRLVDARAALDVSLRAALGNNCGMPQRAPAQKPTSRADVIEALMTASRAMVAIAGRSLADVDPDVTLPQSRALVVLASRGPQRVIDIATDLGVAPSTATRMCDRLVRKGLVRRYRTAADRREVRLSLTPVGRDLVRDVTKRRRDELSQIADAIPANAYRHVAIALQALNSASGEPAERDWWLAPHDPED